MPKLLGLRGLAHALDGRGLGRLVQLPEELDVGFHRRGPGRDGPAQEAAGALKLLATARPMSSSERRDASYTCNDSYSLLDASKHPDTFQTSAGTAAFYNPRKIPYTVLFETLFVGVCDGALWDIEVVEPRSLYHGDCPRASAS